MYRHIYYDRKKSIIHHWGFDEDGTPNKKELIYYPKCYIPSVDPKRIDGYGIDEVPLSKKTFMNEWERQKFLDTYKGKVYFNIPTTQQYLLENYYREDIKDLTKFPLRTFFFDIEVIADEFPDPQEAKFPITSITIYDNYTKKYYVWGIKAYNEYTCKDHLKGVEPDEIVYVKCADERILMKNFVRFWRANFPDLIVGYNSFSFDVPYIINRIEKLFGEGKKSALSPIGSVYGSEKTNKFSQSYVEYTIVGISHLDYMVLYKTFTPGERESDSLDYVCMEELDIGKLDYGSSSLQELCATDWNKFINYNIWDVKLLMMLEEKRKYLEIAKFTAFNGFCNLDKAFGKTAVITGSLAKQALFKDRIIFTQTEGAKETIPGGFVKEPVPGLYDNIMVMDLNSLYPNTIVTLNISPETKVAKVLSKTDEKTTIYSFKSKQTTEVPNDKFYEILRRKGWSLSSFGIMFDQSKKGVCAEFVDDLYQKRKAVKKQMLELENSLEGLDKESDDYKRIKRLADQLDTEQYLYKILLNSTYGALANRFFVLYDLDCAKSITLTGQALIKQSDKILNDYVCEEWNLPEKDRCVSSDTDSVIFSIDDILKKVNGNVVDEKGDVTPEFTDIEYKVSVNLNERVKDWAIKMFNTKDCRFEFKRESVCTKAILVKKKHYVMYIRNSEGVKMDKIKYKGLSVVKSTFSQECKNITKNIVKGILEAPDKKVADAGFFKAYDDFFELELNQIAERGSIKVLDKYDDLSDGMNTVKGCPQKPKFSIYYNELVKNLNLQNKYPLIEDGKKIKVAYLKDNKYKMDGIAFLDSLPEEFGVEVDKDRMFGKCVINCLKPIYEAIRWDIPDPKKQFTFALDELFG